MRINQYTKGKLYELLLFILVAMVIITLTGFSIYLMILYGD
jgi:hypothetical protein